jgi:hypothetical protein
MTTMTGPSVTLLTNEGYKQVSPTELVASYKLDPEVKAKWVAALRSGDYRQGRGALAARLPDGVEYCCLGVLMEIAAEAGVTDRSEISRYRATVDWDDAVGTSAPNQRVGRWATGQEPGTRCARVSELHEAWDPLIRNPHAISARNKNGEYIRLSGLNDHAMYTFEQIADVIEEQL